jgi:NADH-quinone oxidoreductase subunit B
MTSNKTNTVIPVTTTADASCDTKKNSLLQRAMDGFMDFCRARSLFVLHYCTGCGAIELPPAITSRFDLERIGVSPMVTPRQADILLITGYVSIKTLKRIILTYEQMQGPKYVIGICSCTVNGGMYWNSYATAKQLDEYIPVDMYIAGCMPRPEAVLEGLLQLRRKIETGAATSWQDYFKRYDYYLGNQQHLFGNDWHTPTDVIGEARHYQLLGNETLGEHTALLEKYLQHHQELGLSNVALEPENTDLSER